MSIDFPKYTIQKVNKTNKKTAIKFFSIWLLISFLIGFFSANYISTHNNNDLTKKNNSLFHKTISDKEKITQLQEENNRLVTSQKVKGQAVKEVKQGYKQLLDTNNKLESEVKFYERLLSSNRSKKGLRVFTTNIQKRGKNRYLIKLSLVQKIEKARETSGKYEVSVVGVKEGKSQALKINIEGKPNYKFKYFQNITLDFLMPNGFIAEALVVNLFPKNKKAKQVTQTIAWQIEKK